MARNQDLINKLNRKEWLSLGPERRAKLLHNLNVLDNFGIARTGSRQYKRNEKRIARALSNMQRQASVATKARGVVSG